MQTNILKKVQEQVFKLFEAKNKDYGNSFADFGIVGLLVRLQDNHKIDELTKKQKIKVVNYASKLFQNRLCKGYAASIDKVELTKQMMHHTLYWRPTSNPYISPEDEFEVSLKVAYSKIKQGNWNMPKGYR